jgi:hypothetical protein
VLKIFDRLNVIPHARSACDRESRSQQTSWMLPWIPGQTFGLPGMTRRLVTV